MKLAILIPAFNEAETIPDLLDSLPRCVEGIDEIVAVVIDDGSTDATAHVAACRGADVVQHARNQGVADAFRSAIRRALELQADVAVSIDADLQFSPEEIPNLIAPVLSGDADLVVGNRFHTDHRPKHMDGVKYHGNRLMTRLVNTITGQQFSDVSSGYRAYSREALLNLNVQSSFTYTQESFIELAAKGLAIQQIPVTVRYYPGRRSRVVTSVARYAIRTFLTIARTTRDYAPLSIFGWLSVVVLVPGIILALFVLGHFLWFGSFSPYIFVALASVYLCTCGAALFILGLVADMLRGTRANQERLLYFAKVQHYDLHGSNTESFASTVVRDR